MIGTDLTENENARTQQMTLLVRTLVLRELTQAQREVFTAYHYRGLLLKDIARERCCSISTVSRTLKRAEKRLQEFLQYLPASASREAEDGA